MTEQPPYHRYLVDRLRIQDGRDDIKFTEWEMEFADSILRHPNKTFTPKQVKCIEEILKKYERQ